MSDKKSCHVCGTDLEFATDTYCGGTCADIAEMRTHDDQRIAELERENKVLSGRLERELDRAIPILEERNAAQARIAELERERDELRAALGKIALLGEYDGPVVAGSYIDLARAALKAGR